MTSSMIDRVDDKEDDETRGRGDSQSDDLRLSNMEDGSKPPRNMSHVQPGTIIENKPIYEEVFRCISYGDIPALKDLLQKEDNGALNVIEMRDARRFSVLAFACYKNNEECFMILYNHALDRNLDGIKTFP